MEFESSVAVLDGAIPFSGTHPRCDDGSDPLGLAAASLNQNNIKFALDAAMKSAGIESDVTSYTKTEVAVTDNNSLSAYAVSVSIPTSPSQLDAVMRKLTDDGFLVTSDTVVVTAEQTTETIPVNNPDPGPQFGPNGEPIFEDQQSEVITSTAMTTSARLIFWYSSTPEFYQADALEAACSPEATEGQPEEIVEEEAFDAEVPTEEVLLSIDNEYRTLAAFGGGPVPVEEMTPVNGIDFTLSDGNLDGLLEGGDIVALNGMTLVLGTAETPGLIS